MECQLLRGSTVVGRVDLDWETATSEDPPDHGPTIWGVMAPTPAYEAMRTPCRTLRRVMRPDFYVERVRAAPLRHGDDASAQMPVLACASFDSFLDAHRAIEAVEALALRVERPDGRSVPALRVMIEDFSLMDGEDVPESMRNPELQAVVLVAATMPPGATGAEEWAAG